MPVANPAPLLLRTEPGELTPALEISSFLNFWYQVRLLDIAQKLVEREAQPLLLGLEIAHVPVGTMGVTEEAVQGMVDALDEFPRPMLGYCRSGARSTAIYQKTAHIRG